MYCTWVLIFSVQEKPSHTWRHVSEVPHHMLTTHEVHGCGVHTHSTILSSTRSANTAHCIRHTRTPGNREHRDILCRPYSFVLKMVPSTQIHNTYRHTRTGRYWCIFHQWPRLTCLLCMGGHALPPSMASFLMYLKRCRMPSPHRLLVSHSLHSLHELSSQSNGQGRKHISSTNSEVIIK